MGWLCENNHYITSPKKRVHITLVVAKYHSHRLSYVACSTQRSIAKKNTVSLKFTWAFYFIWVMFVYIRKS